MSPTARPTSKFITTIAKLDIITTAWSKVGDLLVGRAYHNAILKRNVFIVVGGIINWDDNTTGLPTEECSLVDDCMVCSEKSPSLVRYDYFPELCLVTDDFGGY